MNVTDFQKKKNQGEKITMITCYDYTSAKIIAETNIDSILVGDSIAMTLFGHESTVTTTIDMIAEHTKAVSLALKKQFIVSDLPFLSYRKSLSKNISAVQRLMQSGAHAVKLEGAEGNFEFISHLVSSGIPVMGHLGLTPQHVHMLGGFKVQGKTEAQAKKIEEDAHQLQEAGCFAIVLECVPEAIATSISKSLIIPTIGIGAGEHTDGQILVFQDLLGLNNSFQPKFVKKYLNGFELITNSINEYVDEVKKGVFPNHDYNYKSE